MLLDDFHKAGYHYTRHVWSYKLTRPHCLVAQTSVFSQDNGQRAVSEAALSISMVHPNVVATYSYNMKPIQDALSSRKDALQIEGGNRDWKLYLIQVRAAIQRAAIHLSCCCQSIEASLLSGQCIYL